MVRIQKKASVGPVGGKLNISDYEVAPWALTEFWQSVAQERVDFPDDGGWVEATEMESLEDFKIIRSTDRLSAYKARKGTEEGFKGNQFQITGIASGNLFLAYSEEAYELPEVLRSTGIEPFGVSGLLMGLAAPSDNELDSYQESKEAARPVSKKAPVKRRK